ncbi:MAG: hypothetical protein ACYSX0_20115 [Planctomycetota bacterium]|jgi:hypothetical protein
MATRTAVAKASKGGRPNFTGYGGRTIRAHTFVTSNTASFSTGDQVLFGVAPVGATLMAVQYKGQGLGDADYNLTLVIDSVTLGSLSVVALPQFVNGGTVGLPHSISGSGTLTCIIGNHTSSTAIGSLSMTMWITDDDGGETT